MKPTDENWPRCACGCGEPVPVRKASVPTKGLKRGEPCKFVARHSSRGLRKLPVDGKKRCPKCRIVKVVEEYHRSRDRPAGLAPWCKECVAAKSREWYARSGNPERITEAARRFTEANPGYRRAAVDRWNTRHRDLRLARARISASAYRARKLDQFVEDVDAFVVLERDEGCCGICGGEVVGGFHVDHVIPLSRGGDHSYANVQLAHPSCNCQKKDRLQEEMAHA